ncbi:MAG TPA: hypothetical protein VK348_09495, partial [Planctomycetota bacterium]|nr:hypothetical protein [Planctomycetota bacterium]
MKSLPLATSLLLLAVPLCAQDKAKAKADKIDFKTSVLPILEKNCFECHRTAYTAKDGKVVRPKKNVVFD